jgi:hypothetical protein
MPDDWQPEAVLDQKIEKTKRELMEYIEKNSEKVDSNIPVFLGHVISILENQFPSISDINHDRFIDEISVKILETSNRSTDVEYIERLFNHAVRVKKRPGGRMIFDIILGIKLIDTGKYSEAVTALERYRTVDVIICAAIAYCYYVLATEHVPGEKKTLTDHPGDMALRSREQLIELVRLKPPVNRLKFPQVVQELRINKIFWFMIRQAVEWFPQEPEYLRIGLEKARKDNNREMREELLKIASERFFDDMFFLRDLYHFRIENRDASGAAAVVKQMMQQYPDDIEPVYYGLLLAIISVQSSAYQQFRRMAASKNTAAHLLLLLDFTFEIMSGNRTSAYTCLEDLKKKLGTKNHYLTMIEYVTQDIFSTDEKRAKAAKKALIDSIDFYCLKMFKIPVS